MNIPTSSCPKRQRGVILIVCLFVLVLISIISISMFSSFGLQEKIAGNTREKHRAFQAAGSALKFAEWWLIQSNNADTTVNCVALVTAVVAQGAASPGQVCTNALANPTVLPLTAGANLTLQNMSISNQGGIDSAGNMNYFSAPQFYIRSIGFSADGRKLFEMTGAANGGTDKSAAVVQSTFAISDNVKNLGGL